MLSGVIYTLVSQILRRTKYCKAYQVGRLLADNSDKVVHQNAQHVSVGLR